MGKQLLTKKVEYSDATKCKYIDVNSEKPCQEINTTYITDIKL